jgi:hypothetical protein
MCEPAIVNLGRRGFAVQSGTKSGSNPEAGETSLRAAVIPIIDSVQKSDLALTGIPVPVGDFASPEKLFGRS